MQAVRYPGISMIIGQLGATRTAGCTVDTIVRTRAIIVCKTVVLKSKTYL